MPRLQPAYQPRRTSRSRHARGYDNAWGRAAKGAIAAWVAANGWVCPGFADRPRHNVEPGGLTGDHRVPVALGGTIDDGIDALCQSCNSDRGQVTRREVQQLRADGTTVPRRGNLSTETPPSELRPACFGRVRVPELSRRRPALDFS